jgi:hypothetical protein
VISSSQNKVDDAVKRLNDPVRVGGCVADARDEEGLVRVLQSLAPIDHIVYSGVDRIIRGKLEDLQIDEAKHLFEVKFWGAVIVGKGESLYRFSLFQSICGLARLTTWSLLMLQLS